MKKFVFIASVLLISNFYTTVVHARGCGALTSGSGVEGTKLTYQINSPLVTIDPDAPTGQILWTRNIDTTGAKWACDSAAQRSYKSTIGAGFSKVVGTNSRGNIYSSGVEGMGIQINDMIQPNRAVPNQVWLSGTPVMVGQNTSYTRIDFIKVGPIGTGNLTNGEIASYEIDGVTVMTIRMLGSRLKSKSCTIDGSYNRTIPLGQFKASDITDTSTNIPFEVKLKCQADAVPAYVQFDPLNGSSKDGLLNIDTTVGNPASGVAIEILNGNDMSPLKWRAETKYHTELETSVTIPLIARYKKTGSVITAGQANAGMTITINER